MKRAAESQEEKGGSVVWNNEALWMQPHIETFSFSYWVLILAHTVHPLFFCFVFVYCDRKLYKFVLLLGECAHHFWIQKAASVVKKKKEYMVKSSTEIFKCDYNCCDYALMLMSICFGWIVGINNLFLLSNPRQSKPCFIKIRHYEV